MTLSHGAVEPKSMIITWTSLPEVNNGGDPIIFYALDLYNPASDSWNQLNFDFGNLYTSFTYTSETTLQASTYYEFRVRPKNRVGYSPTGS